jgi:mRNA interferase MazF
MRNTTSYSRGDIVLVNYVFAEGTGIRRRPAVLLSPERYQMGKQEAIFAAITSNTGRLLIGDHLIADWQEAGLLFPSVVTGILRTIKQQMMARKLGNLTPRDLEIVEGQLRQNLELVN